MFEAIYYAVRQALEQNTTRPEISVGGITSSQSSRMSDAFVPVEREKSLKARQISIDTPPMQKSATAPETVAQIKKEEVKAPIKAPNPQSDKFLRVTAEQYVKNIMQYDGEETKSTLPAKEPQAVSVPPSTTKATETIRETAPISSIEKQKLVEYANVEAVNTVAEPVSVQEAIKDLPKQDNPVVEKIQEAEDPPIVEQQKIEYTIIGEVFNSYIIVQVEEKMLIIDKHAAHERIIFEQLKKNMYSQEVPSQLLMLPIDVMLMSDEVATIEEYREELQAVGFEFSTSRNTVSVTALPVGIEQDAVADMFAVVADRIKNGTGKVDLTRNLIFEKALYQASCKAAIKAGREYAKGHGDWVVEKLMEIPDITFCPHGRPVAMELSKRNIDRQFERT